MRKMILAMFVALAVLLLVGVVPAQAQVFAGQYGPAEELLADNQNLVWRFMGGNWYAGFYRGNQFHALYDRFGRRLSRPVRIAIAGAEIGATIGYARGGGKGALIGAGIGAAPGLLAWAFSRGDKQDEVVVQLPDQIPPMPPPQTAQVPSSRENGWNQRLRDQANSGGLLFGSQRRGCLQEGLATLKNEGANPIRVYQDGMAFADILPRESECGDPDASYEAEVMSMTVDGYAGTVRIARKRPEGRDGLVLVWR